MDKEAIEKIAQNICSCCFHQHEDCPFPFEKPCSVAIHYAEGSLHDLKSLGYVRLDKTKCAYCGKKPDGAMLTMNSSMAHADCVIRKLNELLDPDYPCLDEDEPIISVAWLDPDQSLPESPFEFGRSQFMGYEDAQQNMLNAGFKKVKK